MKLAMDLLILPHIQEMALVHKTMKKKIKNKQTNKQTTSDFKDGLHVTFV